MKNSIDQCIKEAIRIEIREVIKNLPAEYFPPSWRYPISAMIREQSPSAGLLAETIRQQVAIQLAEESAKKTDNPDCWEERVKRFPRASQTGKPWTMVDHHQLRAAFHHFLQDMAAQTGRTTDAVRAQLVTGSPMKWRM